MLSEQIVIDATEIITDNEIMLLCKDDAMLIRGEQNFRQYLDNQQLRFNKQNLILTDVSERWKSIFPSVPFDNKWFAAKLNNTLSERYFAILDQMFDQRDVSEYIAKKADGDAVALILVDGLSYYDSMNYPNVRPCMVPGPTTTREGFSNLVQDGIIHNLYNLGYRRRYGFSFWDRKNEISDIVFRGFPPRNMHIIKEYYEALDILNKKNLQNSFIQISIQGYDQDSHGRHGRPVVDSIVHRIFREYIPKLASLLRKRVSKSKIYLTADHGVWWIPPHGAGMVRKVVDFEQLGRTRMGFHRCYKGYFEGPEFIHWETPERDIVSMLKYPFLAREMKKNEWGSHGGISIFESFVPFLEMDVV